MYTRHPTANLCGSEMKKLRQTFPCLILATLLSSSPTGARGGIAFLDYMRPRLGRFSGSLLWRSASSCTNHFRRRLALPAPLLFLKGVSSVHKHIHARTHTNTRTHTHRHTQVSMRTATHFSNMQGYGCKHRDRHVETSAASALDSSFDSATALLSPEDP